MIVRVKRLRLIKDVNLHISDVKRKAIITDEDDIVCSNKAILDDSISIEFSKLVIAMMGVVSARIVKII
jgi:hypothetical protein